MPIKQSAKKELRKARKRHLANSERKKALRDSAKKLKRLAATSQKDEAKKLIAAAYQAIDKAAKSGVIKKNTAGRKKSRLMKLLNK